MKGLVFTEFLDFVANSYSEDMVDDIIDACDLEHDGAYTAVGTYDHMEMAQLLGALSKETNVSGAELLRIFGQHLMGVFSQKFPDFIVGADTLFGFLSSVENHIHIEVKKLYPDAELPSFEQVEESDNHMVLDYRSCRPFANLAEGLILGAAAHFGSPISIEQMTYQEETGPVVRFTLTKNDS
ncbi:MAG: heme NO-binding domain-containing protein [Cohaesibacter sp.]|jgi:hypothetical protein|nr:heme NO-binding domain-containing protein [Cohaesibacter sp.]